MCLWAPTFQAFASVPVEEGLAAEHRGEVLGDALEHLLLTKKD